METKSTMNKVPNPENENPDQNHVKESELENNNTDESIGQESKEEVKDMDLGELDLEGIEKACTKKYKGYIPQQEVSLLNEAIFKSRSSNLLGISSGSHKETKKKAKEHGRKTG